MTAAIALAVVLVIAVAGASMALESQRGTQPARPRPARPARPRKATSGPGRRAGRGRERNRPTPVPDEAPAPAPPPFPEPEIKLPDLMHSGRSTEAKVVTVVDERTIGPVTRSRLVLRIEPEGGDPLEVSVRHAFPTPEARARVKVGGTVPVRYDADDPRRVVIDLPQE